MTSIVILLLIFFVCLSLIMVASLWYMKVWLNKLIGGKLRDLETLTATGIIPEAWSSKYERRMIRYQERGNSKQVKRIQQSARKVYLHKIGKLLAYVRSTTLVESEEVRNHTLRLLQRVEKEWRDAATYGSLS
jgi:hypothetical protein